MSSVRIANSYLSGALEAAAEYIQNGVRRATNDCVRKTPKVLVVEHHDAGRSRQGLDVENVAITADDIGRDRPYKTFLHNPNPTPTSTVSIHGCDECD